MCYAMHRLNPRNNIYQAKLSIWDEVEGAIFIRRWVRVSTGLSQGWAQPHY